LHLSLLLTELLAKATVHVSGIGVQAAQMLKHDLHFGLELLALLVRFPRELILSLEALDLGVKVALLVLSGSDIFDGC
jgi:hypothetical protein